MTEGGRELHAFFSGEELRKQTESTATRGSWRLPASACAFGARGNKLGKRADTGTGTAPSFPTGHMAPLKCNCQATSPGHGSSLGPSQSQSGLAPNWKLDKSIVNTSSHERRGQRAELCCPLD